MRKLIFILIAVLTVGAWNVDAQTTNVSDADRAAIKQTALDYIEGWYEADAERMERSPHPDLAKRIVLTNDKGRSRLDSMSAMSLVQGVKRGGGKLTLKEKQLKQARINFRAAEPRGIKRKDSVDLNLQLHLGECLCDIQNQ
jgi:hypothetical protein